MRKEEITRRGFLFGIVGGLAALVSGCNFSTETIRLEKNFTTPKDYGKKPERLNEANGFLFDLKEVPGAMKIEKYLTKDAKYCLVHVRQVHLALGINPNRLDEVKRVQENVYRILSYLHDNFAINELYVEGITPENEKWENLNAQMSKPQGVWEKNLIAEYKSQLKVLEEKQKDEKFIFSLYPKKEDADNYKEYLKRVIERKKSVLNELVQINAQFELLEYRRRTYFAAYRLAQEGKVKVLAAEDAKMNRIGLGKLYSDGGITSKNAIDVLDNREDYILKAASARRDPLVVCVFGAGHAFGGTHSFGDNYLLKGRVSLIDNIAKHNYYHPDKKFSLIEITPEDYPEAKTKN